MRPIREQKHEVRWGFSGGFSDTLGIGTDAVQEDARRASPKAVCPGCNRVPGYAVPGSKPRGGTHNRGFSPVSRQKTGKRGCFLGARVQQGVQAVSSAVPPRSAESRGMPRLLPQSAAHLPLWPSPHLFEHTAVTRQRDSLSVDALSSAAER